MTSISRQSVLLMKRTAWANVQRLERPPQMPTEDEKRLTNTAIQMLNYVACLNYAMDDLEHDLRTTGQMQGLTARCFNVSRRIIVDAHDRAYKMLVNVSRSVGREYNSAMDATWRRIDDCVLLPPPERGYNIVVALCRLVERLNRELGMRYYFQPAKAIATIPAKLNGVKFHDYRLDNIIVLNTR